MRYDIAALVERGQRNLRIARRVFEEQSYDIAVSRTYYAMFYAASALLLDAGLTFHKHGSLIAAFGQQFAQRGLLPAHLHRYLMDAFDERTRGDYRLFEEVTQAEALDQLEHAQEFIHTIREYLERESQA